MSKLKLLLKTKEGDFIEESTSEDDDIILFLNEVHNDDVLYYFMEEVIKDEQLMGLFSSHRKLFYVNGFEKRAVLYAGDQMAKRTNDLLLSHYKRNLEKLKRFLEPVSALPHKFIMYVVKAIISALDDKDIENIRKMPYGQIGSNDKSSKPFLDKISNYLINEEINWEILNKELKTKIYYSSLDFFTISQIFPYYTILMVGNATPNYHLEEEKIQSLTSTGIMFPIFTLYFCNNHDSHDYSSPPFHFFVPPHHPKVDHLKDLKCPTCGSKLSKSRFFTFHPSIAKRIMEEEGFYPYIIAYLFNKNEISFISHVRSGGVNETDFIVKEKGRQFYIEVKCIKRKSDPTEISTKIDGYLKQIDDNIQKWEEEKNVSFDGVYLVINFSQNDIDRVKKETKYKIFGYDSLPSLIKEIKGE